MIDETIRQAAFLWLAEVSQKYDFAVPRAVLSHGFEHGGQTIHLIGAKGIWKPRQCDLPLSIATTSAGPYEDGFTSDGLLSYRYRGTDPEHPDNRGLRRLYQTRTPLIYFHSILPGIYVPVWPVFVIEDFPERLTIHGAVDPAYATGMVEPDLTFDSSDSAVAVRRYVVAFTRRRLHQRTFREQVIGAYRERCAICNFRHAELLDAAHIIPDSEPGGDPVVPNGLSLCKFHHAAFDQSLMGISPDYTVHVREDILAEHDGPMLRHGLQQVNGARIQLPSRSIHRPDRERLDLRYQRFLSAS